MTALVACTEGDPGPQFVNDPRPNQTPATPVAERTGSPSQGLPTMQPLATPIAVESALRPRGAPRLAFFERDGQVWAIDPVASDAGLVFDPGLDRVLGFAGSPSADQVAVVVDIAAGSQRNVAVRVVGADGDEVRRVDDIGIEATPRADVASVQWAPQGDLILVGFDDGQVVTLSATGDRPPQSRWLGGGNLGMGRVERSPTGNDVAFVAPEVSTTSTALFRTTAFGTPAATPQATPVVSAGLGAPGSVETFTWLPDGRSLLFTLRQERLGSGTTDLWRVGADGSELQLIASAGVAGPAAAVTAFAPAPAGDLVAYAVSVPGEEGPRLYGVRLHDLATGQNLELSVPRNLVVERLSWTSAGLVVETVSVDVATPTAGTVERALLLVSADGTEALLRFGEQGAATPVANDAAPSPAPPFAATPAAS